EIARKVGIGAVKYADLAVAHDTEYTFDFDRMLALTGNTGPYLQYAQARIRSIFRKGGVSPTEAHGTISVGEKAERDLSLKLLGFGPVVAQVGDLLQPHRLSAYLFELAQSLTTFYEHCPVLTANTDTERQSRLALIALALRALVQGLDLLGVESPEHMWPRPWRSPRPSGRRHRARPVSAPGAVPCTGRARLRAHRPPRLVAPRRSVRPPRVDLVPVGHRRTGTVPLDGDRCRRGREPHRGRRRLPLRSGHRERATEGVARGRGVHRLHPTGGNAHRLRTTKPVKRPLPAQGQQDLGDRFQECGQGLFRVLSAGDRRGLVFVGHQDVHVLQQLGGQLTRRCGGQIHRYTQLFAGTRGG